MPPDLARRIAEGWVIVTPNRRLAAWLRGEYDRAQIEAGRLIWPTADCVPLAQFFERTYAELTRCAPGAMLLGEAQEQALWEAIVAESPAGAALLHPEAAARAARGAWRVQQAYRIDLERHRAALDENARAYLGWTERLREIARARGWLDAARLPDALVLALEAGAPAPARPLALYGFDSLPPQARAVFDALAARGVALLELVPQPRAGRVRRRAHDDREQELVAVARRCRTILERRPQARIGVVVPDLAAVRATVLRVFDDVLDPPRVLEHGRARPRPYNVSLGAALASEPLVHTALLVLGLARGALALEEAGSLLRSPFLAGAERELARRALLDRALRREGCARVEPERLLRRARAGAAACSELAARLGPWSALAAAARGRRQLPSQWSADFQRLLAGLGWPGERALDSEEYQALGKWREMVSAFGALDAVVGALDYEQALARLERLAATTVFQPETPEVPLQVLGVLEAQGLEFEHLFVTGLDDEAWPPPPNPAAFLPRALQRAHAVAHATAEWQLEYARRTTARWCSAADEVELSWARSDAERALGMSPLLAPVAEASPETETFTGLAEAVFAARALEEIADFTAPELPAGVAARGGAQLFADQAACPFRAFAAHRLAAEPLESARVGLDDRERGSLVHRAAEFLWRAIGGSARLGAMSAEQCAAEAARAAGAAVAELRRRRPDALGRAFAALERERVAALLVRLLALERERAPFTVLARERRRALNVGGVRVATRLDRVDRLEDGSLVVLDYKTSREVRVAGWLGERPEEPQLPLYCVAGGGEVTAAAFVQLTARAVRFAGLARASGILPGVPTLEEERRAAAQYPSWGALVEGWRAALEALGREHRAGRAAVAPLRYPETCRHCAFPALCRVQELAGGGLPAGGDE